MTRFAIDSPTALRIVVDDRTLAAAHTLVAPVILRSHALSWIYREARDGRLSRADARRLLDGIATMKIRLLGDRVSRATAFRLADELDWEDTAQAEYLAVATLQADVLVTDDPDLRAAAGGRIEVGDYEALWR